MTWGPAANRTWACRVGPGWWRPRWVWIWHPPIAPVTTSSLSSKKPSGPRQRASWWPLLVCCFSPSASLGESKGHRPSRFGVGLRCLGPVIAGVETRVLLLETTIMVPFWSRRGGRRKDGNLRRLREGQGCVAVRLRELPGTWRRLKCPPLPALACSLRWFRTLCVDCKRPSSWLLHPVVSAKPTSRGALLCGCLPSDANLR